MFDPAGCPNNIQARYNAVTMSHSHVWTACGYSSVILFASKHMKEMSKIYRMHQETWWNVRRRHFKFPQQSKLAATFSVLDIHSTVTLTAVRLSTDMLVVIGLTSGIDSSRIALL